MLRGSRPCAVASVSRSLRFFWGVAHGPRRRTSQPRLRQPTPQSVQQQEDLQASADKIRAETDRKMREMDRRLNRTLRSVCVGC